jgi:hydrogenase maturation factor
MTVVSLDPHGLALCADGDGEHHTVEIALVAPVAAGDQILVHAGVALVALSRAGSPAPHTAGARTVATRSQAAVGA